MNLLDPPGSGTLDSHQIAPSWKLRLIFQLLQGNLWDYSPIRQHRKSMHSHRCPECHPWFRTKWSSFRVIAVSTSRLCIFSLSFFSWEREELILCATYSGARRCREISRRGSYLGFFPFPLAASFQLGCLSLLFRVRNGIVSIRGVDKLISPLSDLSR